MMRKNIEKIKAGILVFLLIAILQSCVPVRKLSYFNDIDEISTPQVNPQTQKLIMPFDKLYIKVLSTDDQTSRIFSTNEEMRIGTYGGGGIIGYIVDENGNVYFPFVGNINVASLTTAQAS